MKNSTMMHVCGFLLAPTSILLMWLDLSLPHQGLMLVLFFVLLPFVRWAWPIDLDSKLDESQIPRWLSALLYWLPGVFALIWVLSALALPFAVDLRQRSSIQIVEIWISIWIASSLTLPACHELIHRVGFETVLARLLGASTGLFFFTEEHKIHHVKSGRGEDPDCAEQSESVYVFAVRSGLEAFWAGWDYEISQQIRKGRSSWSNRIIWTGVVTFVYLLLWAWSQGLSGIVFFTSIALATNFSLRAITFIQHWGLRQVPLRAGGQGVSWVSTCIFQSWLIFNLALHEHHHHNPSRIYWKLRSGPTELKLPVTYPLAFLLSLVPPLYRKIMAPRLAQWVDSAGEGSAIELSESCIIR
jgi:alkane 1-monooxygenase